MDTKEYYLDVFADYLNKSDKSSGTISTYTANIKGFIKYYVESYDEEFIPKNVIMMDLQDYRNYLLNIKRQKASTINDKIAALKEYFFFLMSDSIIKTNPAENLKKYEPTNLLLQKVFLTLNLTKLSDMYIEVTRIYG